MSDSRTRADTQARVLQVVLGLDPGGTERLVVELVQRLNPQIPMAVCCLDHEGAWGRALSEAGVRVTALGRRPGFQPLLGRSVARAARAHGATMIHAHHYSPFVYAALARVWQGPPVIFTEHGRLSDVGPSVKRRWANQVLARSAHAVFTVSRELGQHLVDEGFPAGRIKTIHNGITVGPRPAVSTRRDIRTSLVVDDEVVVVGTIARLDPVKDLGTLIEATRLVARTTRVLLVIVGDGTERVSLERTARASGAESLVRFLGHRDDARDVLAACDVYANSSISEGISLTILEAMAACLPVVATGVGGTPEIVDATMGRLVRSRSPAALAESLAELAAAPPLRRSLGEAARQRVETVFTIERMVGEYAQVYQHAGQKSFSKKPSTHTK